jgi:hypothetical protein
MLQSSVKHVQDSVTCHRLGGAARTLRTAEAIIGPQQLIPLLLAARMART